MVYTTINGKHYNLDKTYRKKSKAKQRAKSLRKKGYNVRVREAPPRAGKGKNQWSTFSRKKR